MQNLAAGQIIPLIMQLTDGNTGKFVKAVVKDNLGTPISGSPFTLTHDVSGKYKNFTGSMPSVDLIEAQYTAYDDAGFTIPSGYDMVTESFTLLILKTPDGTSSEIQGVVDDDSLTGIVCECE